MPLLAIVTEPEGRTRVFFDGRNTAADATDELRIEQAMWRAMLAHTQDAERTTTESLLGRSLDA